MRVTNNIIFNTALVNIQQQSKRLFRTQEEASSGKRVQKPSDHPLDTRRILALRATLASFEQFKRNQGTGALLLQETDTALDGIETLLLRAKNIALNAANATVNPENRAVMAQEVGNLFEQALQFGNRMVGGRYLFGGQSNEQPPFTTVATIESKATVLTLSGTLIPLSDGDLIINSTTIRATRGTDDTVSTSDNMASALAIAKAINEVASTTGVNATASTTLSLTIIDFGDLTGNNLQINGVAIIGTITDAVSLVSAINNANIPGVVASSSGTNNLTLTAADGRNIQLETDGLSTGNMAFTGFDLGGGVALDQTATGTVILRSNKAFTIGGLHPEYAGLQAGPINLTANFQGDNNPFVVEIAPGQMLPVNVTASEFLLTDLRPNLNRDTPLSSLRQGKGTNTGIISITDRSGNTALVDLSGAKTVGEVIDTITNAPGINVSVEISSTGQGLVLTDNTDFPIRNLTVTDLGGGTMASELGIAADRPGPIVSTPLKPVLTPTTPLSLLYEGQGVTPTAIRIVNGVNEVEVDLSGAQTIGDVLDAINATGANVTARINAAGTALEIRSNDPETVATVAEVNDGTTATTLGLQGGQDILKSLNLLQESLQKDDPKALQGVISSLDMGLTQVSALRADAGARSNRIELTGQYLEDLRISTTTQLSQIEDADFVEVLTRLSQLTVAFQAALGSTARIIQPTLMDFLR